MSDEEVEVDAEEEEDEGGDSDFEIEDNAVMPGEAEESDMEVVSVQKQQGGVDTDDEEADRDMQILQQTCLPVAGGPMEPTGEFPKDADEYLRQVQWERIHCPKVVDVQVEDKPKRAGKRAGQGFRHRKLLQKFEEPELPEGARHSAEWEEDVAQAFRALRARCEDSRRGASELAPGSCKVPRHHSCEAWKGLCASEAPSMSLLTLQDFKSIGNLVVVAIERLVSKIDAAQEPAAAALADCGSSEAVPEAAPEGVGQRPPQQPAPCFAPGVLDLLTRWVFSALAFVEEPLMDDMHFQLQRLRRACLRLSSLAVARPKEVDQQVLARSSVLLVIVMQVFGQR